MPRIEEKIVQRFPKTFSGKRARVLVTALRSLCADERLHPNRRLFAVQLLAYLEGLTETPPTKYPHASVVPPPIAVAEVIAQTNPENFPGNSAEQDVAKAALQALADALQDDEET